MSAMTFDKVTAFIDRVLLLKAEQDTLSADIKEVYAEAKSNGFDKTVMGLAVARIRKEQKFGAMEVAETDSLLDLYLHAYNSRQPSEASSDQTDAKRAVAPVQSPANGLPSSPAHTREENAPNHDPITGEIQETETRPVPAAPQPELDGAAEGEGAVNLTPSAAPIPIPPVDPPSSQGMADEAAEGADSQLGPSAADTSDDLALPAFLNRVNWRAA